MISPSSVRVEVEKRARPKSEILTAPSDSLTRMFEAYVETARKGTVIPENMQQWIEKNSYSAREQGVDPMDMLRQKWPMIDVSPEALHRAAWMKKHVRDVSHYSGFMSPKTQFEKAMPTAQLHEIRDYGDELKALQSLKDNLMTMASVKQQSGLEGASFRDVMDKSPQLVQDMDHSLNAALKTLGKLYGGDRFVTKDQRLNPAYDVGEATKMEIFGKGLFLAQAWKAFLSRSIPAMLEEQGILPQEIGLLSDLDAIRASVARGITRFASAVDAFGNPDAADIIDRLLG